MIDEVLTADRLTANLDLGSSAGVLQTVTDLNLAVYTGQEVTFTYALSYTNGNNIGIRLAVNCTGTGTFRGGTIQGNSTTSFGTGSGTALNTVLFAEGAGSTTPNFALVSGTFVATSDGTLSLQACNEGSGACVLNSGSGALFLVAGPVSRTPTTLALTTATFAPTVTAVTSTVVNCAAPTALVLATFAPTVTQVTETFTHADQSGDLSADQTWTGGAAWGIVSNQAKATGSGFEQDSRMEVDADLSALVSVQATLVTFTGAVGGSGFRLVAGVELQRGTSAPFSCYVWVADRLDGTGTFQLRRFDNGTPTTLQTVSQEPADGDVLKLTWNPASNTLKGYVNGTEIASQVDSTYTTNTRSGLYGRSTDSGGVLIIDNVYLTPTANNITVSCAAPTALTLATFAPTITTPQRVTGASPTALLLATFAPTVLTPQVVTCAAPTALILTTFEPTVTAAAGTVVVPETLNVFLATFAPTVLTPLRITPETLGLVLATFEPTVTTADAITVTPDPLALLLATFAPTVTAVGGGGTALYQRQIRGDRPHGLDDWMVSWNG